MIGVRTALVPSKRQRLHLIQLVELNRDHGEIVGEGPADQDRPSAGSQG